MRLYQIILAVPDDCIPDDMEVAVSLPDGHVSLFSEGFISPIINIPDSGCNDADDLGSTNDSEVIVDSSEAADREMEDLE